MVSETKQQITACVKNRQNGMRLDRFGVEVFGEKGQMGARKEVQKEIADGRLLVNGRVTRPGYRLKPGETVSLRIDNKGKAPEQRKPSHPPKEYSPALLFKHSDFIVINKPAGLRVHPVRTGEENTLTHWLLDEFPGVASVGDRNRPGIVHRLDEATSGVMLVAMKKESFLALKKLFHDKKVQKQYLALVYGHLKQKNGSIKAKIGRLKGKKERAVEGGKRVFAGNLREAETKYDLHTRYPQHDLLSLEPKTGRTHQIRVHLASLGHPVVGDRLYQFKKHRQDKLHPPFQLLHAQKIAFEYRGKPYQFQAPLPGYFQQALDILDGKGESGYDMKA